MKEQAMNVFQALEDMDLQVERICVALPVGEEVCVLYLFDKEEKLEAEVELAELGFHVRNVYTPDEKYTLGRLGVESLERGCVLRQYLLRTRENEVFTPEQVAGFIAHCRENVVKACEVSAEAERRRDEEYADAEAEANTFKWIMKKIMGVER